MTVATHNPSPDGPYARAKKARGEWCDACDLPTTQVSGGGFLAHDVCPGHDISGCGCPYDEHDPWCPTFRGSS